MNNSYVITIIDPDTGAAEIIGAWEVEGCDSDAELYAHAASVIGHQVNVIGKAGLIIHVKLCEA